MRNPKVNSIYTEIPFFPSVPAVLAVPSCAWRGHLSTTPVVGSLMGFPLPWQGEDSPGAISTLGLLFPDANPSSVQWQRCFQHLQGFGSFFSVGWVLGHRVQPNPHVIISLCCCCSGLCKIHQVLSSALGRTLQATRAGAESCSCGQYHTQDTQAGSASLLPKLLKGYLQPRQALFGLFDTCGWFS